MNMFKKLALNIHNSKLIQYLYHKKGQIVKAEGIQEFLLQKLGTITEHNEIKNSGTYTYCKLSVFVFLTFSASINFFRCPSTKLWQNLILTTRMRFMFQWQ